MLLNSFLFTGAQVSGDAIYVALWGGAGAHELQRNSSYLYPYHMNSGSGGFVVAKITGFSASDTFELYAGGRGKAFRPATENAVFADPTTYQTFYGAFRYSGSAPGAASAITYRQGGTGTETPLIIAPSGGGAGGSKRYGASDRVNAAAGHGIFAGEQIGTAPTVTSRNPTTLTNGGVAGSVGVISAASGSVAELLIGSNGTGYKRYNYSPGGYGAPSRTVASSAYNFTSDIVRPGGLGGIGHVRGFSGTYTANTKGTATTAEGLTIEFFAFDGKDPTGTTGLPYDVATLRGSSTDFAAMLTALGYPSSGTAWPPEMQGRPSTGTVTLTDRSGATGLTSQYWPGQASQRTRDDGAIGRSDALSTDNARLNYLNNNFSGGWWSNPGAALVKLGDSGDLLGFQDDDATGMNSNDVTVATGGMTAGPNTSINLSVSSGTPASLMTDEVSEASATTFDANTDVGPIYPVYEAGIAISQLLQVRTNDAAIYEMDLTDVTPAFAATTDHYSNISATSGTRDRMAAHEEFLTISDRTNGTQIINKNAATTTTRDRTGSAWANTTAYGLTIDGSGYGYEASNDGSVDMFDLTDTANNCPVIATATLGGATGASAANGGQLAGLAYDPGLDAIWYSRNSDISFAEIERNDDGEPTGLRDNFLSNTTDGTGNRLDRVIGTVGFDDQVFWVESGKLLVQNNDALQIQDVSDIATARAADFVFSLWGAGGGGGSKDESSTATGEDAGPGGNGAFVEVRVQVPALEHDRIVFGMQPGDGGRGGDGNQSAGGDGGAGGGASVLYATVDGTTTTVLAIAAGGGGGGGAGAADSGDAGFGGFGGGVTTSTGVGVSAGDGDGGTSATGGGGATGTAAGAAATAAHSGSTPPTKTDTGQTGGNGSAGNNGSSSGQSTPGGDGYNGASGGEGGLGISQSGAGGGGGGGYFAGAGGTGGGSGSNNGAGGGGGSSYVAVGTVTINGLELTVTCLRSESGSANTGAPTAVAQSAGATNHFSYGTPGGHGGDGVAETADESNDGGTGADGRVVAGHYASSSEGLAFTSYNATASTREKDARLI